jgi:hypothetical protein
MMCLMRKTPSMRYEDTLPQAAMAEYLQQAFQIPWTMGWGVAHRAYHVPLVRINLTQNIVSNIPGMLQQVVEGLQQEFGEPTGETQKQ